MSDTIDATEISESIQAGVKYYETHYGLVREHADPQRREEAYDAKTGTWHALRPNQRVDYLRDAMPLKSEGQVQDYIRRASR